LFFLGLSQTLPQVFQSLLPIVLAQRAQLLGFACLSASQVLLDLPFGVLTRQADPASFFLLFLPLFRVPPTVRFARTLLPLPLLGQPSLQFVALLFFRLPLSERFLTASLLIFASFFRHPPLALIEAFFFFVLALLRRQLAPFLLVLLPFVAPFFLVLAPLIRELFLCVLALLLIRLESLPLLLGLQPFTRLVGLILLPVALRLEPPASIVELVLLAVPFGLKPLSLLIGLVPLPIVICLLSLPFLLGLISQSLALCLQALFLGRSSPSLIFGAASARRRRRAHQETCDDEGGANSAGHEGSLRSVRVACARLPASAAA
jgi:hypothetical protein